MRIYTKWIAYDGKVGVTELYEYYEVKTAALLKKEVHQGAIYYRAIGSKGRYSFNKINKTKKRITQEIYKMPF